MFKLSQLSFSNQHVEIAPFLPHHTWYQFSHISRGKKAQKAYFYKSESISKMSSLHSYASLFQSCFFISLCLILVSLFRVYLCFIFKDFFPCLCVPLCLCHFILFCIIPCPNSGPGVNVCLHDTRTHRHKLWASTCMFEVWFPGMCVRRFQTLEIQMWNAEWNEYSPHRSPPPLGWVKYSCYIAPSNMKCS